MRYDEKTGKKVPECRCDEIDISFAELGKAIDRSNGTFDRSVETNWLLRDISVSLGHLVDMMGLFLNTILKPRQEEPAAEKEEKKAVQ